MISPASDNERLDREALSWGYRLAAPMIDHLYKGLRDAALNLGDQELADKWEAQLTGMEFTERADGSARVGG